MRVSGRPIEIRPEVAAAYRSNDTLWERLKAACPAEWDRYLQNDFIWHLADGSLSREAYRHFIVQDYFYCVHYARGYILGAYKSQSVAGMRKFLSMVNGMLVGEMKMHNQLLEEFGMNDEELDQVIESHANTAYTRYILDCGIMGDVLDLFVSLAPCTVGYGEVGTLLLNHEKTKLEDNPYLPWIEMYAGEDFHVNVRETIEYLDELAGDDLSEARFAELAEIFAQTVRLDIEFWDMAYNLR